MKYWISFKYRFRTRNYLNTAVEANCIGTFSTAEGVTEMHKYGTLSRVELWSKLRVRLFPRFVTISSRHRADQNNRQTHHTNVVHSYHRARLSWCYVGCRLFFTTGGKWDLTLFGSSIQIGQYFLTLLINLQHYTLKIFHVRLAWKHR